MRLRVQFLSLLISCLVIFHPTLIYAGEGGGIGRLPVTADKPAGDRPASLLPSIYTLLLSSPSPDFGLIPGPTTLLPILAYYDSGSQQAIFSSVAGSELSYQPRSLYMDSLENVIVTYFGCDYEPHSESMGYYRPFAININGEVIIRVLDCGWNPDVQITQKGQAFLTVQSELPNGTILGTAHLRSESDRMVSEITKASGETTIVDLKQDPRLLEGIINAWEYFYQTECIYLAPLRTTATGDIYSDYDLKGYMKNILRMAGIALGIIGLIISFPVSTAFLPAALWSLSAGWLAIDIVNFLQGKEFANIYERRYKEMLDRKGELDCVIAGLRAMVILAARKVSLAFDASSCFSVLWSSATKLLDDNLYKVPSK